MKVNELQAKQGKVEIVLDITEKSEPKAFQKWGKDGSVCNAKGKDDTGEVTITLWNDQIDKVKVGDKIEIKNGYVGEWQNEKQLSTGKFGTLEVIGEGEAPAPTAEEKPAAEEAPAEAPAEETVEEEKVE